MANRFKKWLQNALLTIAALGVTLLLTEVIVRTFFPQPTGITHQDRYGLALHYPGISRYLPLYGHRVSFNSAGMRDREHSEAKPAGTFRVLLLGDSFMEALQVPFEASLPSLLERSLEAQTGRPVEVINAGVSGWGTDDELRYLRNYGLKYQPDLVVVAMTLHNDISDNLRQEWHELQGGLLVERDRKPMSFREYQLVRLKAFLSTRFQTYQLWRRVRHGPEIRQAGRQLRSHVVQLFEEPSLAPIPEGVRLTSLLLREVQVATGAAGGQVALVLLPIRYQLSDSIFSAFLETAQRPPAEMQINKPQQSIASVADSLGIPVIDLLPRFRQWTADTSAMLYFDWDGHWNETGHRVAAQAVSEGLLRVGAVR